MDKEYMVTIPLSLYNELLEIRFEKARVEMAFEAVLDKAELSWNKDSLDFTTRDIKNLIKSISLVAYERRIEELKKEDKKDE